MKKVIVIGCSGSGKTTFAEKLRDKTGLPLIYLDAIWHKADKTHITRDEFDERLTKIFCLDEWIIDGHYSRTLERRMSECDTVIFFDLPISVCLDGVRDRVGKQRNDMPWIDYEIDPNLKNEIEKFADENLPTVYALLDKYKDGKEIIIFKSRAQADEFLKNIN